jgi:hypothetical protein
VSGKYARDLYDNIFPGATKYGVQEYSIERAVNGEEFYLESTCGGNQVKYFRGKIRL